MEKSSITSKSPISALFSRAISVSYYVSLPKSSRFRNCGARSDGRFINPGTQQIEISTAIKCTVDGHTTDMVIGKTYKKNTPKKLAEGYAFPPIVGGNDSF